MQSPIVTENPFFELRGPKRVSGIARILEISRPKTYFAPGISEPKRDDDERGFQTVGLFRGQRKNWPLIPKAWRNLGTPSPGEDPHGWMNSKSETALAQLRRFSEHAAQQHPAYPDEFFAQMCIAQHFRVPTPLLDWSKSIFAALHFAIHGGFDEFGILKDPSVFIYHIPDERLFPDRSLEDLVRQAPDLSQSRLLKARYLDPRMERQKGAFTYHPVPSLSGPKIPVDVYEIEDTDAASIHQLMQGLGFTKQYFFPDYAAIAEAVADEWENEERLREMFDSPK